MASLFAYRQNLVGPPPEDNGPTSVESGAEREVARAAEAETEAERIDAAKRDPRGLRASWNRRKKVTAHRHPTPPPPKRRSAVGFVMAGFLIATVTNAASYAWYYSALEQYRKDNPGGDQYPMSFAVIMTIALLGLVILFDRTNILQPPSN